MTGRTERLRCELGDHLADLVEGCGRGDADSWQELLEAVRKMAIDLGRHSYHMHLEDAEDLAQLVQIRIAERLPQLRQPAAFPLWVRRVIHHAALDMLRQRHPIMSLEEELDEPHESRLEPSQTDPYDLVLLRADLERALSRLPERYQEPIRLHILQDMPQDTVGRLLGRPRSTVATQIERGLGRLRRSLSSAAFAGC